MYSQDLHLGSSAHRAVRGAAFVPLPHVHCGVKDLSYDGTVHTELSVLSCGWGLDGQVGALTSTGKFLAGNQFGIQCGAPQRSQHRLSSANKAQAGVCDSARGLGVPPMHTALRH